MSKKSFILHLDSLEIIEQLNINQKAKLLEAIYYYNVGVEFIIDDSIKFIFHSFKKQFDRDFEKYQKSQISGRVGNLKKYHEEIYKEYVEGKITLEAAEIKAYPQKKEIIKSRPPIAPDRPRSLNVSVNDSVNVNVNDNTLCPQSRPPIAPDRPRQKKFDDFHLQSAIKIADIVRSKKQINITNQQINDWANQIRLLEKQDLKQRATAMQDIIKAIEAIDCEDKYCPVVQSGFSFREKFTKIEDYIKRKKSGNDWDSWN